MVLQMMKGTVYRVTRRDPHSGKLMRVEIVKVGPTVAKRAIYTGDMVWHEGLVLAIFHDVIAEAIYAQPAPK